jgi:hypothetical protein
MDFYGAAKLFIHLDLMLKLSMRGSLPPIPYIHYSVSGHSEGVRGSVVVKGSGFDTQ